jgi:hypothetical protein
MGWEKKGNFLTSFSKKTSVSALPYLYPKLDELTFSEKKLQAYKSFREELPYIHESNPHPNLIRT